MSTTTCPTWCTGGHGPRAAHASPAAHTFGVITALRQHHGQPTLRLSLDVERRGKDVTLDLEELDRVIGMLTNHRNRLAVGQDAKA